MDQDQNPNEPLPSTVTKANPCPTPLDDPTQIGRYRVIRLLGKGGFGRVYLAHDEDLNRSVAIKVPRSERVSRPEDVEAYLNEARIVASLDHAHIVPVYDVGRTEDGLCFVVSKFIEGSDLATKIKESRPGFHDSAALVATIAEALHHAHTRGLVHRDIKPANILIDLSGRPFVADFGLALKDDDFGKGRGLVGTTSYMSPEQARGEGHRVDGRSDIFSLGVVLYELLTGRRPFVAKAETKDEARNELLDLIANTEARPPRQINDKVPKELERICLKALSKRASDRYTTAADMADDLKHWLRPLGSAPDSDREVVEVVQPGLPATFNLDKVFFVSYASEDQQPVYRLCRLLEDQGIGCWIAPRDVQPGADYGEAIVRAIEGTRATLLFLSKHSNASIHVTHEVERATSKRKRVVPVRLEDIEPSASLELHLATPHRVDVWRFSEAQLVAQLASVVRGQSREPATPVLPADTRPISNSDQHLLKIVPKGLRSFDEHDADFFLELLPGPRDRDGLPESIRFWKRKIEQLDPDLTFKVGLIYGPSGCGKSSLVKAGLLPRLAKHVLSVYIEATPDETESRLLNELRKACPDLPTQLGLVDSLMVIRQGKALRPGQKVLLVLDQFEQWLHAKQGQENTELVKALRQCDGERVQSVVMVRDDFWLAVSRFMADLEVELVQGENTALVDLFDLRHARKVLAAFGNAYGNVPDRSTDISRDQHAFLDQAITELAQANKVISVRLALFAEMVKGKPWNPATLREVGGIEGVGVTFLEETFSSPQANPKHRLHQKAAQAVLRVLLPERGSDIKGQMRSDADLRSASAYADSPRDFTDLLHILNNELRLITPTDPEGSHNERPSTPPGGKYYQLTHDYLVPSLREWLTRKQRETRKGRAELRLAERSALWNDKPENRHLPSVWEWANIRLLTEKKDWTNPQKRMMKRAGRVHGVRSFMSLVLAVCVILGGLAIRRRVTEDRNATHAEGLVEQVLKANISQVPGIVDSMRNYRPWVDPALKAALAKSSDEAPEKLHASLALLPVDHTQADYLYQRLLKAAPGDLAVIGKALRKDHQAALTPKLWSVMDTAKPDDSRLLPAASALALFDPDGRGWASAGDKVAGALGRVNPILLGGWIEALRPVRGKLTHPLAAIFRDHERPEAERSVATTILADYASDDGGLLASLLMDAEPPAFAALYPVAERQKRVAIPLLQAEIKNSPKPDWQDPPLPSSWIEPDPALVRRVEATEGSLGALYGFCQTMPLEEFRTVAEALWKSGYRPTRFRPYADGLVVRVAAVWTRDGRNWLLDSGLTSEVIRRHDDQRQADGYLPVDVAGYIAAGKDGKPADHYAALWVKRSRPDEKARVYVGVVPGEHKSIQDKLKQDGFVPMTLQAMLGPDGKTRFCGVWVVSPSDWNATWDLTGDIPRTDDRIPNEHRSGAICLSGSEIRVSRREQARLALASAEQALKEKPEDFEARFARAKALCGVGEWQKALDDLNPLVGKAPKASILYRHRSLAHAHLRHKDDGLSDLAKYRESEGSDSDKLAITVVVTAEVGAGETQAIDALKEAVKKRPEDSGLLYDAACAYSLASLPVSAGDKIRGREYAEQAASLLARAIRQGYSDYDHILDDADLDPIRDQPGYTEALNPGHLDRRYAAVWKSAPGREAIAVNGLDPSRQRQRCRELEAEGYRPVSFSAARTTPDGPAVTASVWQRPVVTELMKDRLAERQARAAIALVRMGKAEDVWILLRHSADSRLRSFIVNWLNPLGADPRNLVAELDRLDNVGHADSPATRHPSPATQKMDAILFHPETSMRRALILALGSYATEGLSPGEKEPLIGKLLDLYRNDPDAGIHGAAKWALRQWKSEENLKKIDAELSKLKDRGERRWFVNSQGQTFAVIEGPVEFVMGSPPTEPDHLTGEIPHRVGIPRRFAIAAKEVSKEQWQAFVKQHPEWAVDAADINRYSPDPGGPMVGFSWYIAAQFCNWLSEQEGLPKDQWCYLPAADGKYTAGMTIPADVLRRKGYRLPTEAEWEYACRSGTMTSRYHGPSLDLLEGYARYQVNSKEHAWACASRQPNDLGLFDMLGNMFEWVQDKYQGYRAGEAHAISDDINTLSHINDNPRLLRGGAFDIQPAGVRSASRD